jgi:hypothetical protein
MDNSEILNSQHEFQGAERDMRKKKKESIVNILAQKKHHVKRDALTFPMSSWKLLFG